MRKVVPVFILLLLVISMLPRVSGQFDQLETSDEITILRDDYSSGMIWLTNAGGLTYKVVSYQRFWVEDSEGNKIPGFEFNISPSVFTDWSPKGRYSFSYNISCPSNVSGGTYTLYMRFLAFTPDGLMYILFARIPLHVIAEPLNFGVATAYVQSRPSSSYVLNGEKIVVFSHVANIGHRDVPAVGSVSFVMNGKTYFSDSRNLTLVPGDNLVKFEIPVGYDLPEGSYRVNYRIRYSGGEYTYSKDFQVKFGVTLVGVSLKSGEVSVNEENTAYLTLLSERVIDLNLTVEAYRGGELVSKATKPVRVVRGTTVLEASLPTNVSGNITALLKLTYGERLIGEDNVTYTVSAPLVLKNVSYERTSENEVTFRLTLWNPSESEVDGILTYRISTDDGVLYKDSIKQSIPSGSSEVTVKFEIPVGKTVYYEFALVSAGESSSIKGQFYLEPPAPPTTTTRPPTTTTPSTTTSSNTTTAAGGGGSRETWIALVLVAFILLAVGTWYYLREQGSTKKRVRPKPKRRSPLGRFKRPKKPEFKENKELPKRK
ncbi:COG1361 family protein [Thermococcus pacificus]|uniref:CARDB domain-containing protein n=1 Tax=Thermococcus pacificus TaxID=71998 RepID=A0A218P699_9EURY|nr:hypothetical protein [Thermococcus pacificus]ASJ06319.1 hypothetical protein A3L08_02710 [Thermococcus pacificus]